MRLKRQNNKPSLHKRIIFLIILPVVIVGTAISGVLIASLSPPMESFLIGHFEANLRLASRLGVGICDTHFNQLIDMRLEESSEMNIALKQEALEQIKAVGRQIPNVHMLVLEDKQFIKAISIDFQQEVWRLPASVNMENTIIDIKLGEERIKANIQYFPFWNWHIISFVMEKDYFAPISTARQIIYLSTIGVLVAVFITLLAVFHQSVTKPLNRLIVATKDVTEGKLLPVHPIQDNEIGQLFGFFNKMVKSLKIKTEEVGGLIHQLKKSEERYRSLVELSPEAVFVQQGGIIKYINRSGANTFGAASPEELIGRPARELIHPDFHKAVESQIKNVDNEFVTLPSQELKYVRLDQRVIDVEATGAYIEYSGKPALLSVIRDITERKQAEEVLRKSEEKLARSKKMESLGVLAGGVAHDLNNVLSGIVSYPELILMDLPEDSKLRLPIKTMQESGHRAAAIVQDLLTVARGVATIKEPLNLNDLVNEYLMSPEFAKLKQFHPTVTVNSELDKGLFNVKGSSVHIRKGIMNLVSNATESIEGGGHVTISTTNRYVDLPLRGYDDVHIGEYAILTVSDDGSGISPGDLDRIFEPFYTKKVMGRSGTGLGLAVVWNVVQDHQGYIDVKSNNTGTTFELYFPITRADVSDKDFSISIKDYKGNGETILVIDDVKSQREISCNMLKTLGYKTHSASSGEEAVAYLQEHSVDLLLLDMIMDPGINGCETYRKIIKYHPHQKAIIVSGFAETDDVRETQRLGAGKYIKKPLTLERIGLAIKEELEK